MERRVLRLGACGHLEAHPSNSAPLFLAWIATKCSSCNGSDYLKERQLALQWEEQACETSR